jgi:hypothetical protein
VEPEAPAETEGERERVVETTEVTVKVGCGAGVKTGAVVEVKGKTGLSLADLDDEDDEEDEEDDDDDDDDEVVVVGGSRVIGGRRVGRGGGTVMVVVVAPAADEEEERAVHCQILWVSCYGESTHRLRERQWP